MKKSQATIVIVNIIFSVIISVKFVNKPQEIIATTVNRYVKTRANEKARLYNSSGKLAHLYAMPKRKYQYSEKKKLGRKKLLAYKIGNNSQWLLAKDAQLVKKSKAKVRVKPNIKKYVRATIKLPQGYTKKELLKAYQGKASQAFIDASMYGMKVNDFSRLKLGENTKDKNTKVDVANLSADQLATISSFSLRLINEARRDLKLKPWRESYGASKLADDIAREYFVNNRTIRESHYVEGIVRACHKNGLNFDNNYIEDMAGFYNHNQIMTMTELKQCVYFGLKQMIFGYVGSGEAGRFDRSNYKEWEHAGDLFNTQGSLYDGDYNYFGFSISVTNNICSMHFISIPTNVVKNKKYNFAFQP
ncbi:SEC10/PgrA surface exclusion domain-containing protein [Lactobacillus sp. ESL0233]|uniref:SEC10/PgrA surface exclusion domain-containing protein n=1 Tax=Lactobacillus sp. ESL0233 TaxID=2069354 RepID=UPI000EFB3CF6|nr:SEC10/PgrA surface exclusion domain-containing protein [Lactobacillus sp. ESL0233]MCO6528547.1 SEC10/PgrA surface exclusion domain-containing protein [Lactobacillus sp.]RMC42402.1 SEC10/PgrA surface exclusion domain-containing protein [Lactobacillus sp. ESL0233]